MSDLRKSILPAIPEAFLLGHTKVDHWCDPVEDKEYKQESQQWADEPPASSQHN